jgi:hypothetical protein
MNTDELRCLPPAEKLRIVEMLWDDLGECTTPIPLPDWVEREASRRREEMRDPDFGFSHEQTWDRIHTRSGL